MIDLRVLGSTGLQHADGHVAASVLAQPRRLALLVWLALASPRGFRRRDTILTLFWPESDDERARAALRQAVRFIRRSLGDDVIVNRGEDEIGIAEGTVACDVVAFERALVAGADAGALELYRGDLLDGFHIDDAPAWEHWLDGERDRLRRAAAQAAGRLADHSAAGAEWTDAIAHARRACDLTRDDEAAVRRLIDLLGRAGDGAGAIAEYERFAARLRAEMEIEPAPETRAAVAALRRRPVQKDGVQTGSEEWIRQGAAKPDEAAEPTHAASPETREKTTPRPMPPATSAKPARPAPRGADVARRLPRALAVASVLLLATAGAYYARSRPAGPALPPQRFLVAPFENLTGKAAFDALGRMAADWISQGIAGVGGVQVVPTMAQLGSARTLDLDASGVLAPADLTTLARDAGAGRVIAGSYYLHDGRLLFQARITETDGGGVLRAIGPTDAPLDTPLAGVEALRTQLRAALAPMVDAESHARAAMTPPTYEAYREYVAGTEAFVRRDLEAALRHMQRAAAHDTAYPMPLIVSAIVHSNMGNWAAADSIITGVDAFRDRLAPLERHIHDMVRAWIAGDDHAAYDAVVRQRPLVPGTIAHYQVAEQARRLNRPREALRVLRELAPDGGEPRGELRGWLPYWREVAWSNHMLGRHRDEVRALRPARELYPDAPDLLLHEARGHAALGRIADIERLVQRRLAGPVSAHPSAGVLMRTVGLELQAHGRSAAGQQLLERSVEWYRALPARTRDAHGLGLSLYAAARLEEAAAAFEDVVRTDPEHVAARAHLGIIAARLGDVDAARSVDTWLSNLPSSYLHGQDTWWRACIAAALGQRHDAIRLLREAMAQGFGRNSLELHIQPALRSLRDDPDFRAILRPTG
jgi:DNA-binding SARP family transcriptional activator/tetratricopeptide (TPR) repeat protein